MAAMLQRYDIAFCVFSLTGETAAPYTIQLFPAGEFSVPHGAMRGQGPWRLDGSAAQTLITRVASRSNPLVIDYEHQSLLAAGNGQPAPAAGWVAPDQLAWVEGAGLFAAAVQWTERAKQMIAAGEYRYLSPVFTYDAATGVPTDLLNVALTNNPAIDGMQPVLLAAARRCLIPPVTEKPMLTELRELLGVKAEAPTDDEVKAACGALLDRLQEAELKAAAAAKPPAPDPAQYAPVAALKAVQDELAALRARELERDVRDLVEPALADGRLLLAQEQWARDLGKANLVALRQYLESAMPIAALRGAQTGGKGPVAGDQNGLSPDDLAVCAQLGLTRDEFLKVRKEAE